MLGIRVRQRFVDELSSPFLRYYPAVGMIIPMLTIIGRTIPVRFVFESLLIELTACLLISAKM